MFSLSKLINIIGYSPLKNVLALQIFMQRSQVSFGFKNFNLFVKYKSKTDLSLLYESKDYYACFN